MRTCQRYYRINRGRAINRSRRDQERERVDRATLNSPWIAGRDPCVRGTLVMQPAAYCAVLIAACSDAAAESIVGALQNAAACAASVTGQRQSPRGT